MEDLHLIKWQYFLLEMQESFVDKRCGISMPLL